MAVDVSELRLDDLQRSLREHAQRLGAVVGEQPAQILRRLVRVLNLRRVFRG